MEEAIYRSDGYLGLSGAAELYLNSLARDIAPIRLTGNWGSELLRGVRAFKLIIPKVKFITPDLNLYLKEAQQKFEEFETLDPISFALFHQAPYQGYGRLSIEESQLIMRTPFMDNGLVKILYQRPVEYSAGTELYFSIIARYRPDLIEIPTDCGDLGIGNPLKKVIMSAYRNILFKGEYWASQGMPHWVAALTYHVPWFFPMKYLLGRHKFQHYRLWLRSELSEYVKDVLLSNKDLSNYFNRRHLEEMIICHLKGKCDFTDEIDKALTIVLNERIFLS
jgi:asparagine synthase (glutamine-hydrolysing)